MFQFPRCPPHSAVSVTADGLPHSEIVGSQPARGSPTLFAALPRPSSARSGEASSVCSFCLPCWNAGRAPSTRASPDAALRPRSVCVLLANLHLVRCCARPSSGSGPSPLNRDVQRASRPVAAYAADIPRKEVIQPHLPVRLPCYDFVPVAAPALGRCLLAVSARTSGIDNSHDVTGGVYKARVRIHRAMADTRLLATPPSRGRVAAPDLH